MDLGHGCTSEALAPTLIQPCIMTCFASMDKATQHELRLAGRMSRLGTETAFEVLNKARALERQGKKIIHLEIGEPDFDTPTNVVEAGIGALRAGWTHYGPSAGLTGVAASHRRGRKPFPRSESRQRRSGGGSRAASRLFFLPCLRWLKPETKSSSPILAFPFTSR